MGRPQEEWAVCQPRRGWRSGIVNGSLAASELTLGAGGTLGGSGEIMKINLEAGGILAQGNSVGMLSLGGLTWSYGGELLFDLASSMSD